MIALMFALEAATLPPSEFFPYAWELSSETTLLIREYWQCASDAAIRLEPSGATPTEIATAALASCTLSRNQLVGAALSERVQQSLSDAIAVTGGRAAPSRTDWSLDDSMIAFENHMRANAILVVAEIRAARTRRVQD